MSKPFDAATKHLIEHYPGSWLRLAGIASDTPVRVIDADLAAVQAQADKVLWIETPESWLVHLELQSGYEADLGDRLLRYNVLLRSRHAVPVRSMVVLLRSAADGPQMSGQVRHSLPAGDCYLEFRYDVIRIWQMPPDELLSGGLGTLPLTPVSDVKPAELPGVIRRIDERLRRETSPAEAGTLWTAAFLLLGLRYSQEFAQDLLKGISAMKESTTYQAILEEGRQEGLERGRLIEARAILLRLGRKQFGPPSDEIAARLDAIDELDRLERMSERLHEVSGWGDLLDLR